MVAKFLLVLSALLAVSLAQNCTTSSDCNLRLASCVSGVCSKCIADSDCTSKTAIQNVICDGDSGMCVSSPKNFELIPPNEYPSSSSIAVMVVYGIINFGIALFVIVSTFKQRNPGFNSLAVTFSASDTEMMSDTRG